MILSDREIAAALEREAVRIVPYPPAEAWSSTAVDLSLDARVSRWRVGAGTPVEVFCPGAAEFNFAELARIHTETVDIPPEGLDLPPQGFLLAWTAERIQLPHRSRIAARVEGKSSLARLGLGVHVTAPTIHAGFGFDPQTPGKVGNPIQLEIHNLGPLPIRLLPGLRICQLIFEEVHGTPQKGYAGLFADHGPAKA